MWISCHQTLSMFVIWHVCVVDVSHDTITSTLCRPELEIDHLPHAVAVLGETVMVGYIDDAKHNTQALVIYKNATHVPASVIPIPEGQRHLPAITADRKSHFLVTDWRSKSLFVIDITGTLRRRVYMDTDGVTQECAVVNRKLWVGCLYGDVVTMSSQ